MLFVSQSPIPEGVKAEGQGLWPHSGTQQNERKSGARNYGSPSVKFCGPESYQKVAFTHHCFGELWRLLCVTLTEGSVRRTVLTQDDRWWQCEKESELYFWSILLWLKLPSWRFILTQGLVLSAILSVSHLPEHLELHYLSSESWWSWAPSND